MKSKHSSNRFSCRFGAFACSGWYHSLFLNLSDQDYDSRRKCLVEKLIVVNDLVISHRGGYRYFKGVNLEIEHGDFAFAWTFSCGKSIWMHA